MFDIRTALPWFGEVLEHVVVDIVNSSFEVYWVGALFIGWGSSCGGEVSALTRP
jgi:hypothetical protein